MVSRLYDKIGLAGLVVALVALVAALGGAAYAAGGLTKEQEKQVKKIAKKYAGKQGPEGKQGPGGPAGPKGEAGAKGDTGADGKQGERGEGGEQGPEGEAGFCSEAKPECIAPAGAMFTGAFSASSAGSDFARVAISFPLQITSLSEPVESVEVVEPGGSGNPDKCPGSYENPEAEPGFVCLYELVAINAEFNNVAPTVDFTSGALVNFRPAVNGEPITVDGMWAARGEAP